MGHFRLGGDVPTALVDMNPAVPKGGGLCHIGRKSPTKGARGVRIDIVDDIERGAAEAERAAFDLDSLLAGEPIDEVRVTPLV
jgi:hypothetical protein